MGTVAEIMTRGVEVVSPDDTLQHAARMMDELNIGALPVCEGDSLVGMITDRDITVRATGAGLKPDEAHVADAMTAQTRWCSENQSTEEVLREMSEAQVRRLPVLGANGRVVGIVSLGDLATRQSEHIDSALRAISSPSEPDRPRL
jgi:CBS domain-containing protein